MFQCHMEQRKSRQENPHHGSGRGRPQQKDRIDYESRRRTLSS
jgi:hypothetical protein